MKKNILIGLICGLFLLTGCGKYSEKNIVKDINKKFNNINSYHIEGNMEIYNGEDVYKYKVKSSYDNDNYRVSLTNKSNDHEQIILRNSDGVYVLTPSLNKSFKFQSEWPTNSSQSYILKSILSDIKDDQDRTVISKDDNYEITTKVNYPNNTDLKTQIITIGKDKLPKNIVVKNENGSSAITMKISKIDVKVKYDKNYFALSSNIKEDKNDVKKDDNKKEKETSNILDDVVYPMYLPTGTTYSSEEVVTASGNERVILTYTGAKPFILIEENATKAPQHETTQVSGEVVMYNNVLGILTESSLNWNNNGKEYYLIGDSLSGRELLQIASSTAQVAISK